MILWLGEMSKLFQFLPETFALGVCVLNRLLSAVKVSLGFYCKQASPSQTLIRLLAES